MLRLACRRVAANAALAALLDHHLFGSAVAEALLHGARLDARLERQGFCRDTEFLLAWSFVDHSAVLILFTSCAQSQVLRAVQIGEFSAALPAVRSLSAVRYRTRVWLRDRNVLLAGPASSAACTTFDRPSAKSNSSEVSAVTIGNSCDSSPSPVFRPAFCRAMASNFRIPSAAPSPA